MLSTRGINHTIRDERIILPSTPPPRKEASLSLRDTPLRAKARHRLKLKVQEFFIEKFLFLNGLASIIIIALIFVFLFRTGIKAFIEIKPLQFIGTHIVDFSGQEVFAYIWQPVGEQGKYSLIPLVLGSLLVAIPATIIATILGLGTGVYLAEIASRRVRELIKPAVELLAGIPTIIIGFLCLSSLGTIIQNLFHTTFRLNAFVGALGVSLVIIPVIATITEDTIRAIPDDLREAAYALGATKWETTWRVLIPAGISGITAAILLGMGRAIGETMIVLMATGNAAIVTLNIFSSVRTMTATIAGELGAVAQGSAQYYALFLVGATIFTFTFFLNLVSEIIVNRMRAKLKL